MRALALLLTAILPLGAQMPASPRGHGSGPNPMARILDLSPGQQTQAKAIREKHRGALKADRAAVRAQAEAFQAVMQDPKTGEAQLRQAFDQMNAARFQAMLEARAMHQEMRAILTPDQQAKADAMKAQFQERRKARMAARRAAWQQRHQAQDPQNN